MNHIALAIIVSTLIVLYHYILTKTSSSPVSLKYNKFSDIVINFLFFVFSFSIVLFTLSFINPRGLLLFPVAILLGLTITFSEFILTPWLFLKSIKNTKKLSYFEEWLNHKYGVSIKLGIVNGKFLNAFAFGAVPFSMSICIGNQMLKEMSEEKIKSILIHEYAHIKLNHIFFMFIISTIGISILFVSLEYKRFIFPSMSNIPDILQGCLLSALYGVVFVFLLPRIFMKKFEYQADIFAAKEMTPKIYLSALEELDILTNGKLSKGNNLHPTLKERKRKIENFYKTKI